MAGMRTKATFRVTRRLSIASPTRRVQDQDKQAEGTDRRTPSLAEAPPFAAIRHHGRNDSPRQQ